MGLLKLVWKIILTSLNLAKGHYDYTEEYIIKYLKLYGIIDMES